MEMDPTLQLYEKLKQYQLQSYFPQLAAHGITQIPLLSKFPLSDYPLIGLHDAEHVQRMFNLISTLRAPPPQNLNQKKDVDKCINHANKSMNTAVNCMKKTQVADSSVVTVEKSALRQPSASLLKTKLLSSLAASLQAEEDDEIDSYSQHSNEKEKSLATQPPAMTGIRSTQLSATKTPAPLSLSNYALKDSTTMVARHNTAENSRIQVNAACSSANLASSAVLSPARHQFNQSFSSTRSLKSPNRAGSIKSPNATCMKSPRVETSAALKSPNWRSSPQSLLPQKGGMSIPNQSLASAPPASKSTLTSPLGTRRPGHRPSHSMAPTKSGTLMSPPKQQASTGANGLNAYGISESTFDDLFTSNHLFKFLYFRSSQASSQAIHVWHVSLWRQDKSLCSKAASE
jgi:hypothetical protein